MNKSFVLLPTFPTDICNYVKSAIIKNIDINHLDSLQNDVGNIQGDNLVIKTIWCNILNYSQFKPEINVLISRPNMGMAIIHTDKSRYYSLNIPIIVDHERSSFVAGKSLDITEYSAPTTFSIDQKKGQMFSFQPDMYELVKMSHPILINTKLPHTWTNYSDNFRIVASLSFKDATTYQEAYQMCRDWL